MKQAGRRKNVTDRQLADEKFYKRTADRRQGRNRYASGSEGRMIQADSWQQRQNVAGRQLAEDIKTVIVIDRQLANNRM